MDFTTKQESRTKTAAVLQAGTADTDDAHRGNQQHDESDDDGDGGDDDKADDGDDADDDGGGGGGGDVVEDDNGHHHHHRRRRRRHRNDRGAKDDDNQNSNECARSALWFLTLPEYTATFGLGIRGARDSSDRAVMQDDHDAQRHQYEVRTDSTRNVTPCVAVPVRGRVPKLTVTDRTNAKSRVPPKSEARRGYRPL